MSSANLSIRSKKIYLGLMAILILADQVSKWLISRSLDLYETRQVIRGFLRLWCTHNPGAVWGLFSNHESGLIPKVITGLSIIALILVSYFFLKVSTQCRLELVSFSLVLAGAIGNNIDRLRLGYVVDFIDFYVKRHHFPTFNVADSCISCGVVLLALAIWRGKCSQF